MFNFRKSISKVGGIAVPAMWALNKSAKEDNINNATSIINSAQQKLDNICKATHSESGSYHIEGASFNINSEVERHYLYGEVYESSKIISKNTCYVENHKGPIGDMISDVVRGAESTNVVSYGETQLEVANRIFGHTDYMSEYLTFVECSSNLPM